MTKEYQLNEVDDATIKIGLLVRNTIKTLNSQKKITPQIVLWLSSKKYCKDTFDINYPFLKKVVNEKSIGPQRKINGYDRYWKDILIVDNESYLMCNDWYERNRTKFTRWSNNIHQ
ncbi:hypothetical protein ACNRWW_10415 [Metabacillus sp. HB246100]